MVDQPGYGTNTSYYIDTIEFRLKPKLLNSEEICNLYLKKQLSASQIAKQKGTVKSVILSILHRSGVRLETGKGRMTNPENYRHHKAPYGYTVRAGKLTVNRAELRVCRMIVELMGRKDSNSSATARELVRRGCKNRTGKVSWDHKTVKLIFNRWKDKI